MGDTKEASGSRLQISSALDITSIWAVNQQMGRWEFIKKKKRANCRMDHITTCAYIQKTYNPFTRDSCFAMLTVPLFKISGVGELD